MKKKHAGRLARIAYAFGVAPTLRTLADARRAVAAEQEAEGGPGARAAAAHNREIADILDRAAGECEAAGRRNDFGE